MVVKQRSDFGLGRVGIWSFDLDMQPMTTAQEAAIELEELGFKCVWVPEAVGREPFASCALLLAATKNACTKRHDDGRRLEDTRREIR